MGEARVCGLPGKDGWLALCMPWKWFSGPSEEDYASGKRFREFFSQTYTPGVPPSCGGQFFHGSLPESFRSCMIGSLRGPRTCLVVYLHPGMGETGDLGSRHTQALVGNVLLSEAFMAFVATSASLMWGNFAQAKGAPDVPVKDDNFPYNPLEGLERESEGHRTWAEYFGVEGDDSTLLVFELGTWYGAQEEVEEGEIQPSPPREVLRASGPGAVKAIFEWCMGGDAPMAFDSYPLEQEPIAPTTHYPAGALAAARAEQDREYEECLKKDRQRAQEKAEKALAEQMKREEEEELVRQKERALSDDAAARSSAWGRISPIIRHRARAEGLGKVHADAESGGGAPADPHPAKEVRLRLVFLGGEQVGLKVPLGPTTVSDLLNLARSHDSYKPNESGQGDGIRLKGPEGLDLEEGQTLADYAEQLGASAVLRVNYPSTPRLPENGTKSDDVA